MGRSAGRSRAVSKASILFANVDISVQTLVSPYRIFGIGVGPTLINTKLMAHEEFYAVSLILLLFTAHRTQRNEYATTGKVCWSKCKIHAILITIFSKLKARAKWILLP